ncbi:MAG: hypothetical protein QM582_07580 [Micropruina sp.]|uniref:hypothetical protein n=1 Tax=Micropruina sp. TaxID=2737536 RepID=UPI0039E3261B
MTTSRELRRSSSGMGDEMQPSSEGERKSLDLVQRTVVSLIVGGVIAKVAIILALYVVARGRYELPYDSVIGLWVMSGVIGLVGAASVLLLNRRRPYHPLVLLGLLPMAVSAYWLFG